MSTVTRQHVTGSAPRSGFLGLLVSPFVTANRIFRPARPDIIADAAIERAQLTRTTIGMAATGWLLYAYPLRMTTQGLLKDKAVDILVSTGVIVAIGPIVLLAFVIAARPSARRVYWRRLRGPLTVFGALFGSALVLWFLVVRGGAVQVTQLLGGFQIVGLLVSLAGVLFAVPFAIAAAVLCVHHCLRMADVSEVLPPVSSMVLVWVLFILQAWNNPPVAAPPSVRLLFLLGPPVSVTLLSAWELRRLRVRHGLTLRAALAR
ncbi:hypothetical protein [Streptomyces sp. NPDC101455]|uniref:hypothetical protein n=1 Tax=Streptomyces sp. NPDC101455 TaxID=3366142 RepID=UPI0038189554